MARSGQVNLAAAGLADAFAVGAPVLRANPPVPRMTAARVADKTDGRRLLFIMFFLPIQSASPTKFGGPCLPDAIMLPVFPLACGSFPRILSEETVRSPHAILKFFQIG